MDGARCVVENDRRRASCSCPLPPISGVLLVAARKLTNGSRLVPAPFRRGADSRSRGCATLYEVQTYIFAHTTTYVRAYQESGSRGRPRRRPPQLEAGGRGGEERNLVQPRSTEYFVERVRASGRRHLPLFPSHLACADRLSRGKRAKSRRESSKPEKTKKKRVQLTLGDLWARMGGSLVRKNRATTSHYRAQGPALRKKKKERRRQGGVDGRSVRLSRVVCLSSASCVRRDRSCAQRKGTGSQREGVKGVVGCNHGI